MFPKPPGQIFLLSLPLSETFKQDNTIRGGGLADTRGAKGRAVGVELDAAMVQEMGKGFLAFFWLRIWECGLEMFCMQAPNRTLLAIAHIF